MKKVVALIRSLVIIWAVLVFTGMWSSLMLFDNLPMGKYAGWTVMVTLVLFFAEYSYVVWRGRSMEK